MATKTTALHFLSSLLCSCSCHHLPPPARPSPHLLHFSCNHGAMQMLRTERFVLPSPGHHSQLPEPLSWPPRGGRRGSHYRYHSQAQSLHCQTASPTHKVLDDFTKTSNFSRTPFIMTNRNQSLQTTAHSPWICLLIWLPKMAQGEKKGEESLTPPPPPFPPMLVSYPHLRDIHNSSSSIPDICHWLCRWVGWN